MIHHRSKLRCTVWNWLIRVDARIFYFAREPSVLLHSAFWSGVRSFCLTRVRVHPYSLFIYSFFVFVLFEIPCICIASSYMKWFYADGPVFVRPTTVWLFIYLSHEEKNRAMRGRLWWNLSSISQIEYSNCEKCGHSRNSAPPASDIFSSLNLRMNYIYK